MFKSIKDTYKKSEAAVVVQNLLEMQSKLGNFHMDPASSANDLVGAVWIKFPHLFDGRFGQRPHKISVAAAAFANAIMVLDWENINSQIFTICLGNILNEVSANGRLYPFSNLDTELLDAAARDFMQVTEAFNNSQLGQEMAKRL